jgi:aspartate/methionine/tyrosine aminotransferase
MPIPSDRTNKFTESVIRRMTRVANSCGAVNLSQGFPDFSPPAELLAAAAEAAKNGPHQYAVTWGAPAFRTALAKKQSRWMGLPLNPDEHVVVTCGSTEAMMASMLAVVNPGDKVIIFSPYYENYAADAILAGAEPIYVPLHQPDFSFDPDELCRAFAQHPKALILCNPGNPTGKVFSRDELNIIAHLALEYDVFVLTDEVYEHIVYAPHEHVYFASLPGMFERTLSCGSLSKTYAITGWRLGYVIGPENVIKAVRNVHDFLTVGAAAPLQEAAITALQFPDSYYAKLRADYTARRNIFLGYLNRAGLRYTPPQGAYYVLVDIGFACAGSDVAFSEWMAREVGVAAVPGSSFFREPVHNLIRLHFAKNDATLHLAGQRLLTLPSRAEQAFFHYSI